MQDNTQAFYLTYLIYINTISKGSKDVRNQAEFDLKRLIQVYIIIVLIDWAAFVVASIFKLTQ
jgi:hypothetical protein